MHVRFGSSPSFLCAAPSFHRPNRDHQQPKQPHFGSSGTGPAWVAGTVGVMALLATSALHLPVTQKAGEELKADNAACRMLPQAQDTFKRMDSVLQDAQKIKAALAELRDSDTLEAIQQIDQSTAAKIEKLPKLNDTPDIKSIQQSLNQKREDCNKYHSAQKIYETATNSGIQGAALVGLGSIIAAYAGISALRNKSD